MWDGNTGRCLVIFEGHDGSVTSLNSHAWHGKQVQFTYLQYLVCKPQELEHVTVIQFVCCDLYNCL
jgi:hypothetical protein